MDDGEKKLQSYQMQMLIHLQREDPDEAMFVQCTSTPYPTQTSIHLAIYTWSFFWYITQMHLFRLHHICTPTIIHHHCPLNRHALMGNACNFNAAGLM